MTHFDKMMQQIKAMANNEPIAINAEFLRDQTITIGLEVSGTCKEFLAKLNGEKKLIRGDVGVFLSLLGGLQTLMAIDKQAHFLPPEPKDALTSILMAGIVIARTELLTNFEEEDDDENPLCD